MAECYANGSQDEAASLAKEYPQIVSDEDELIFNARVKIATFYSIEYILKWLTDTGEYTPERWEEVALDEDDLRSLKGYCDDILRDKEHPHTEAYLSEVKRTSLTMDRCLSVNEWRFYFRLSEWR
jgi:hypothetical protein